MDWNLFVTAGGFIGTLIAAVFAAGLWLSRQFSILKDFITEKLEYHEKHDDERFHEVEKRFSSIRNDIWEIRVRNASIDGRRIKKEEING